jgi:hypothetical protein
LKMKITKAVLVLRNIDAKTLVAIGRLVGKAGGTCEVTRFDPPDEGAPGGGPPGGP